MTQIICDGGNVVRYTFDNEVDIAILQKTIVTPTYDIGDLHMGNCSYYQGVNLPSDYKSSKYVYTRVEDVGEWTLNPDYTKE